MIQLPNGCFCTGMPGNPQKGTADKLPVLPTNWDSSKASVKGKNKTWFIHRFYDPKITLPNGNIKPKQVIIKGSIKCICHRCRTSNDSNANNAQRAA